MNTLDWLLVMSAVLAAFGGYRAGFVARATSWLGLAAGVLLASRVLPAVVSSGFTSDGTSLLLVVLLVLMVGAGVGQAIGFVAGSKLRLIIPPGPLRIADHALGSVAGLLGVVIGFWFLLPTMADTPGWPAQQARGSVVAEWVHGTLPTPPDTVRALRRLVGNDLFPRVLDGLGSAPELGPPPPGSGIDAATQNRVAASTVKVETQACGRLRDGSGALIGPGLIVTNAHVVAGSEGTVVYRHPDNARIDATIVAFDPNRDLAILRVGPVGRPALTLDNGKFGVGGVGAVFGHPRGGPLKIQPFKVGEVVQATGRDIYDRQKTQRQVFFLSSDLASGDSGGALIDGRGVVVGVAFAIAPDRPSVAYALTVNEVKPVLAKAGTAPVSAGPCID